MKLFNHPQNIYTVIFYIIFAAFLTNCATIPNEQRIDNIPMYGQPEIERPESFQKLDQKFIKKAASGFGGSRQEASKAWAAAAEDFMRKGNLHYAMRRFNQSWLLDPNNYLAYWGFGRITLERSEFDASIKYFKKATELINDEHQKPALLSDAGSAYTYKAMNTPDNKEYYFEIANQNFNESSKVDPSYKEVWRRWAYSLFEQGNYKETWEKVKKAHSVGARPLPQKFLAQLSEKMPEPK